MQASKGNYICPTINRKLRTSVSPEHMTPMNIHSSTVYPIGIYNSSVQDKRYTSTTNTWLEHESFLVWFWFVCCWFFCLCVWFFCCCLVLVCFFFFLSFSFREQQQFTADKIFKKKWLQLKKLPDFLSRFIRPSQHCFSNQISTGHFF